MMPWEEDMVRHLRSVGDAQAATLERVRVLAYSSAGLVAEAIRRALGPAPAKDPRKPDCPAHDTRCTEERCHWLTKHPLDRPIPRMQGPAPAQAEPDWEPLNQQKCLSKAIPPDPAQASAVATVQGKGGQAFGAEMPAQAEPDEQDEYPGSFRQQLRAAEARCAELEDKLQREQCLNVELEVKLEAVNRLNAAYRERICDEERKNEELQRTVRDTGLALEAEVRKRNQWLHWSTTTVTPGQAEARCARCAELIDQVKELETALLNCGWAKAELARRESEK